MRQLVSVVTNAKILYFLHDGNDVTQIAEINNPGLDVRDVVALGVQLGDVIVGDVPASTNGHRQAKPKPPAPRRTYGSWGLSTVMVLDDIRAHPETNLSAITERLIGSVDPKARNAVGAHLGELRRRSDITVVSTPLPNVTKTTKDRMTYRIEDR